MKRYLIMLAATFFMLQAVQVALAKEPVKAYQNGTWAQLTKANVGGPLAVHFWGVTCAPCMAEMPQWGQFLSQNKQAKVIFVQVDDVPPEMVQKMLQRAKLQNANNFSVFQPFDDAMRYEVDPKWHGETPITILIDKNGQWQRKTGPVQFAALKTWFLKQQ